MKKRGVLSLWKVILLVVTGLLGVVGVTTLTLYLSGQFDEKRVEPADMSFSQVLDEGAGIYNASLGQFEVSSDFKLTIFSTTEGVTDKDVTLSLKGGKVKDGFVSDGIIKVPQKVLLNKPFSVTLESEYNAEILEDWTIGGISTITAKSENVLLPTKDIKIAVDVPVYDIDVKVEGSTIENQTQEVVVGSSFKIETAFTPEQSEYIFSSNDKKEIFYAFTSSYITYDWNSKVFVAKNKSGNNFDTVSVYTFANSYYQNQILDKFKNFSGEELSNRVLAYFVENPQTCVSKSINVKVLDIDVDTVEIDTENKSIKTYLDKYFTITASSTNGDSTFGLSIKDSNGMAINSLFANVGIKIPKGETGLNIIGGKIMKVDSTGAKIVITQEVFDKNKDYVSASNGIEYYVLPDVSPKNYSDYFWKLSASVANDYDLKINFFYEDEEGNWKNFFSNDAEKSVTLTAEEHDYEEDPAWTDYEAFSFTINFDENGNAKASSVTLSDYLNAINSDNIYRNVKYFLFVDQNETPVGFDMTSAFSCKSGVVYNVDYKGQPLSIEGENMPDDGYVFYEIEDDVLTAIKSFSGNVNLVAVTIKTNADKQPYKTEDGKYYIVKVSRVKEVRVESTLSITNMDPTFSFADDVVANGEYNNEYYIPAVNKNNSGEAKTMINFKMVLKNSEDSETDINKVVTAFNTGDLKVVCVDGTGTVQSDYITLQGLSRTDVGINEVTFEGVFAIEEGYFSAGRNTVDRGTYIKLQLQYNDGKEVYTKDIYQEGDLMQNDHFYIYYQQPVEFVGEYQSQTDLDKDGDGVVDPIKVTISATNGIEIVWGNRILPGNATEEILNNLNTLLSFKMTDQFGNEIKNETGIYSYRFVEVPEVGEDKNYLSFDGTLTKISNFISTQGQQKTTSLIVEVVDKDNNPVYVVGDEGNVTTNVLKTETLKFNIISEGISMVEYYDFQSNEWKETSETNISEITVRKYVTSNEILNLNSLIKVYISDNGSNTQTNNVMFKLDKDFISSLSSTSKKDIMNMVGFTAVDVATLAEGQEDTIENYRDKIITEMTIKNPFKEDTNIVFSVTDTNSTLYEITLTFVCLSDIIVNPNFSSYYQANSEYLVKDGNASSVFADESYDLDEFITFSSYTGTDYSWASALGSVGSLDSSENGVFYEGQQICTLTKENGKILLNIGKIYQFKTVDVVLYYGIHSSYACSVTIRLYLNPNLIVRETVTSLEKNPFVNLMDLSSQTLSNSYQLYKATGYIEKGTFEDVDKISYDGFSFEFVAGQTENQYITISSDDFNFGFVNESTLNLSLGKSVEQKYNLYYTSLTGTAVVDGLKIIEAGSEKKIVLFDADENRLNVAFTIGCGGEDSDTMASTVLKRIVETNSYDVNTVVYNGKTNLVLLSGSDYCPQDDFVIDTTSISADSDITSNSSSKLKARDFDGYMSYNNFFRLIKQFTDSDNNVLSVSIEFTAIVTKIGEQFVYYSNLDSVDFDTLIGDYTALENAKVYQTFTAGNTYEIFHNEKEVAVGDAGFYVNKDLAGLEDATSTYEISIIENAQGYVAGLAEIENPTGADGETKLKLNHLESSYDNAFVVLKLVIKQSQGSANYTCYYRIKVEPNYTIGSVTYPYKNGGEMVGEYLDSFSEYFDGVDTYTINFNEQFDIKTNSAGEKRFGNINWLNNAPASNKISYSYRIKSVKVDNELIEISAYSNYFDYSFEESLFKLTLKNSSEKLTVIVERIVKVDNLEIVGSEMEYIFRINQASNYVHTLSEKVGDNESSILTANKDNKNLYTSEIKAGSGEIVYTPSIKISSNGIESVVNEFSAYLSTDETNLDGHLKFVYVLKKGTEIFTDSTGNTSTGQLENDIAVSDWDATDVSFTPNENGVYTITVEETIGETTKTVYYYVKEAPQKQYAYVENGNIHLYVKENINKDSKIQIGFFTDEKIVFKLNITITSFVTWELSSTEFSGGNTYTLFKDISSASTTNSISSVSVTLKDSESAKYVKVTENASDWKQTSVSFAQLVQDISVDFVATITFTDNTTYTFNFTLDVKASFNVKASRVYNDTERRYGQKPFIVEVATLTEFFGLASQEGVESYKLIDSSSNKTVQAKDEIQIIPENVENITKVINQLTVGYYFNGNKLFEFAVSYKYDVYPNVTVVANYPDPDSDEKTITSAEYIATTENTDETTLADAKYISDSFDNFFNSTALFGTKARVVVTDVEGAKIDSDTPVEKKWQINVASMTNAVVYVVDNTGNITKTIKADSSDKMLSINEDTGVVNLKFGIVNLANNGEIEFNVVVNNVPTTYKVVLVAGSNIQIATHAPNYSNNRETIYAEDLAKASEQTIFAPNRILNFKLNSSAVANKYYVKYKNGTVTQLFEIDNSVIGQIVNLDLGKSYADYKYVGTYISKTDADEEQNDVSDFIFDSKPVITARMVAYYYDGTIINFENVSLSIKVHTEIYVPATEPFNSETQYYTKNGNVYQEVEKTNASESKLSSYYVKQKNASDYKDVSSYTLTDKEYNLDNLGVETFLKITKEGEGSNVTYIYTGAYYNVYLDSELTVINNADNADDYEVVEILAGTEKSLLSDYNSGSGFGIKNKRTGLLYSADTMLESSGKFSLAIYGFSTLKVESGDNLQNAAYKIHTNLIKQEEGKISYYTGLAPRAGVSINTGLATDGDITKNYIAISGDQKGTGKDLDYIIHAQGANNDGNHVMMRLTYTVDLGEGRGIIETNHNILFKVVNNSEVKFKSKHESASIYNSASSEIVENKTVASNKETPYEITSNSQAVKFNLWNTNTGSENTGDKISTIVAKLYGNTSSLNNADRFTYTYTPDILEGYNDFSNFDNEFNTAGTGGNYWDVDDNGKGTSNNSVAKSNKQLTVNVPKLDLGVRKFIIEAEDDFGFKLRFYFTLTAPINPTIYSVSNTTIKEGESLAVGLRYNQVSANKTDAGNLVYESFKYVDGQDTISITPKEAEGNYKISKAVLTTSLTTNDNGTEVTKNYTKIEPVEDPLLLEIQILGTGDKEGSGWKQCSEDDYDKSSFNEISGDEKTNFIKAIEAGASIVLSLEITRSEGDASTPNTNPVGYFTVTYGKDENGKDIALKANYNYASSYTTPVVEDANLITLAGMDAYAFPNSLGAVDINAVEQASLISKFTNIEVEKIEFYLGETYLGGSKVGSDIRGVLTGETYNKAPIITDENYSFVKGVEIDKPIVKGNGYKAYDSDKDNDANAGANNFVVPAVDGIYYGTGSTISNVRMVVTIIDSSQSENSTTTTPPDDAKRAKLETQVSLVRQIINNGESLFSSNEISDSNAPSTASNVNGVGAVYNDTLEVNLQAKSSVTFAISDKEMYGVDTETSSVYVKTEDTLPVVGKTYYQEEYTEVTDKKESEINVYYTKNEDNTYSKATEFNAGTTYYTREIEEVYAYTKVENPVDENIENYYEIINSELKVTSDTTVTAGKTYYTVENPTSSNYLEKQKATFITKSNNNSFAVTEYVGITSSVYGISTDQNFISNRYLYSWDETGSVKFVYNGSSLTTIRIAMNDKQGAKALFTLSKYSSITLHINDVSELNNQNYKNVPLYFVFSRKINDELSHYYQHIETFKVYPNYRKATHETTDTQGNPYYQVDYMKVSNGTSEYYLIRRDQWAKDIKLNGYTTGTNYVPADDLLDNPYKYHYEINSSVGGAGSAFIDESGLITTSEDFKISEQTITVNVYMKVSGQDGNYEKSNTKLLLGSFRIYLNAGLTFGTTSVAVTNNCFTYNSSVITIPDGYSLYTDTALSEADIVEVSVNNETSIFACAEGETVNLGSLVTDTGMTNVNYHLVAISNATISDNYFNVYYNNLNSYTFDTAGNYYISIISNGRSGAVLHKNIRLIVTSNNNKESLSSVLHQSDTESKDKFDSNYTYYENSNGVLKAVTGYTPKNAGIEKKTYIAVPTEGGDSKLVDITFYVYGGDEITLNVVLAPQSNFNLTNLVTGAEFYLVNNGKVSKIVTESFTTQGTGAELTREYIVVGNNEDGSVYCHKYTVTYKFASTDVTSISTYIGRDGSFGGSTETGTTALAKAEIAKNLGIEISDIKNLYTIDSNILTDAENYDLSTNFVKVNYLAVYTKDSKTYFKRFAFTFYVYKEAKELTVNTLPSTAYSLSELNSYILKNTTSYINVNNPSQSELGKYYIIEQKYVKAENYLVGRDYFKFTTYSDETFKDGVDYYEENSGVYIKTTDTERKEDKIYATIEKVTVNSSEFGEGDYYELNSSYILAKTYDKNEDYYLINPSIEVVGETKYMQIPSTLVKESDIEHYYIKNSEGTFESADKFEKETTYYCVVVESGYGVVSNPVAEDIANYYIRDDEEYKKATDFAEGTTYYYLYAKLPAELVAQEDLGYYYIVNSENKFEPYAVLEDKKYYLINDYAVFNYYSELEQKEYYSINNNPAISYYTLNSKGELERKETITLEQNTVTTYYVKVGDDFYLITFNIFVEEYDVVFVVPVEISTGSTIDLLTDSDFKNTIINTLNESREENDKFAFGSDLKFYTYEDGVLTPISTFAISADTRKSYIVEIGGERFFINFSIFTQYQSIGEISVNSQVYQLSNLDTTIKGIYTNIGTTNALTYYALTTENIAESSYSYQTLTPTTSVVLMATTTKEYIVFDGSQYFAVSVTFNVSTNETNQ